MSAADRKFKRAEEKYREFHDLEVKKRGKLPPSIKIPAHINREGVMKETLYHSKKWDDPANYYHDHNKGVKCCIPGGSGPSIRVPQWLREAQVLVYLGTCLGFTFIDNDGEEVEAAVSNPKPKLYCTPNGKALLVISGRKLEALIWGGDLDVEEKGIIG